MRRPIRAIPKPQTNVVSPFFQREREEEMVASRLLKCQIEHPAAQCVAPRAVDD